MATFPCIVCHHPAVIGPCQTEEEDVCSHDVTCPACQRQTSQLSVNLILAGRCPYAPKDLPLFQEAS